MIRWVWGAAAVAAVLAAVTLAGGFATVPDRSGVPVAAGEVIDTDGVDVRLDAAGMVDGRLRLQAELTNRGEATAGYLRYGMVSVALPDGTVLRTGNHQGAGGWDSALDPDVPAPAVIDFDLAGSPVPDRISVLVRRLEPASGFLASPGETSLGRVVAVVDLEVAG